jgi:catechol 2,3-dioxygenase-like lactoylglutathione lyase family enzyme
MDHVGIVVNDLETAAKFFAALGMEMLGDGEVGGPDVDRITGLEGVRSRFAMMKTPDGNGRIELIEYLTPAHEADAAREPANVPGLRHLAFEVDDIEAALATLRDHGSEPLGEPTNYGDSYWLCYVRGPDGIIVELAQQVR